MSTAPIRTTEEPVVEEEPTPEVEPTEVPAMAYLTKDAIRRAPDLKERSIEVPEWGGIVKIRPLTVDQRATMKDRSKKRVQTPDGEWGIEYDNEDMELNAFILGIVDPKFGPEDIDWLRKE
ncbi:hypothetical protein LCGC14_2604700, partial [marine sediment metagenome]